MNKNMKQHTTTALRLLLAMGLVSLTACGVDSGFDINPQQQTEEAINPVPTKGQARIFTTTADGVSRLVQSTKPVLNTTNMAPTTLELDPNDDKQTMDGFGYGITYSTAFNLLKMTQEERTAFLKQTFSPTEGYGASYVRIAIGCSDFSSTEYTLCDKQGLDNFALQSDETNYIIPVMKEILAINPEVKVIAAPWTCPKWMKVQSLTSLTPYDSWTDGHLNPAYRQDYAQYFVRFVKAMQQEGIQIYAVSPQNEPLNHANCASLYMPWAEEAPFVKELAKAFKQSGLTTKIYVYDHNYDYASGQEQYPIKVYNALGNDYEGSELVVGAAYHDYGGSPTELSNVYAKDPTKDLIFTESSIGTWNDGRNLSARLMSDMNNVVLGTVNRMCKAVMVWNLMLDTNMGPNLAGGCQTCYGAVDLSASNYSSLSYNSHYYIISQIAAVVKPGAVRLGEKRAPSNSKLLHAVFLNPDGTYAAVLTNTGDEDANVTLSDGTNHFQVTVPTNSVVSARW